MLKPYQIRFIELALSCDALKFGDFTLKSGRLSPYFFNSGAFDSSHSLKQLGACFADAISDRNLAFDCLFGPAYKGISLATATACALERDVKITFNRKEAKAHGEQGIIMGAPLKGKVLIIDDVITSGSAKKEAIALIQESGAQVVGVVIALDREEKGDSGYSASQELMRDYGVPVFSILSFGQLIDYIKKQSDLNHILTQVQQYRDTYGAPCI